MITLVPDDLPSVWKKEYFQSLGIKDHIHEISIIQDEIMRVKNSTESKDVSILNEHLDNELADLYLILGEYLDNSLILKRHRKFIEKSKFD